MKFKGTWILFLVVVLLSAYAYFFDYQKEIKETEQKEATAQLIQFKPEQINKIELKNPTNLEGDVVLSRSADGWQLETPVKDWADNTMVDEFVDSLSKEKYIEIAKEGEGVDWGLYGFPATPVRLIVYNQMNQKVEFQISSKKNFEGNVFLRKDGGNQVLVGTPTWASRADKKTFDFRDKRIFRNKIASINKIEVQSQKDKFLLEMNESTWVAPKYPEWKIDQNKVREFITQLSETNAMEFLTDRASVQTEKNKYNLNKPLVQMKVTLTEKVWNAKIAKHSDNSYYAYVDQPEFVAKIQPSQMDKFTQAQIVQFRDKKTPFNFDKQAVKKIEVHLNGKSYKMNLNGDRWTMSGGEKDLEPNQDKIKAMFDKIKNFEVSEFKPNNSKPTFSQKNELKFFNEKDQVEFEFYWDKVTTLKTAEGDKKVALTMTNHLKEGFYLDEKNINELSLNELVKKIEAPNK